MKISCLVFPSHTSCLDMWTPRVRFKGPPGSLTVPERAQGGGSQGTGFLEAWEKMVSNSSSSGTSCLRSKDSISTCADHREQCAKAAACGGSEGSQELQQLNKLSYMELHLLQ